MNVAIPSDRQTGTGFKAGIEWLGTPGLLLLGTLFVVPIIYMLWRSLSEPSLGFQNYQHFFSSATYLRVGSRTLWVSLLATAGCVLIGTPVAYGLAHFLRSRVLLATLLIVLASFLMSSLVRAFAWMVLLGAGGPLVALLQAAHLEVTTLLSTQQGVLIGMIHFLLPIYILAAFAGLRSVRFELIAAAEGLGATHGYALWTIYLPLALPALLNASSLVFVTAIGFFITPTLLGGPGDIMLAQLIAQSVNRFGDFGFAAAAGFILLATTIFCLGAVRRMLKPRQFRR
jgi:putative spermidine/putrescine transport system permease protein